MWLDHGVEMFTRRPVNIAAPTQDFATELAELSRLYHLVAASASALQGYLPLLNLLDDGTIPSSLTQEIALTISEHNGHHSTFGRYASNYVDNFDTYSTRDIDNSSIAHDWFAAMKLALKAAVQHGKITPADLSEINGDPRLDWPSSDVLGYLLKIWNAFANSVTRPSAVLQSDITIPKCALAGARAVRQPIQKTYAWAKGEPPHENLYPADDQIDAPTIYIIDADEETSSVVKCSVSGLGYRIESYKSVETFASHRHAKGPNCILVNSTSLGPAGSLFFTLTQNENVGSPLIFVSDEISKIGVSISLEPTVDGSLRKPLQAAPLREAIRRAISYDFERLEMRERKKDLQQRYHLLTQRERQVLSFVLMGLLNKQIAGKLSISEITVKLHRRNLMQKLGARNSVDLALKASHLIEP